MPSPKTNREEKKKSSISELIKRNLLEQRKIFFWGEVSDETCRRATEEFLYLEQEESGKEITFYVNTPGGSVTAGMALYDTVKAINSPVKVVVMGMAASMGSIFVCMGAKGRRYILPHGCVLIHQPLIMGRIVAPAIDINIHAQEMEKQRNAMNQILANASGQPIERIEKDTDRDFYMNAKEAIEYGLIDAILEKF